MSTIADNLSALAARIHSAAQAAGATGQRPAAGGEQDQTGQRHSRNPRRGVRDVGENYLQEALAKQEELRDLPLIWHFIGPIQSNKTKAIAEHFDWVHSVDRLKIAQRLSEQRPAGLPPLNICLQVNVSGEDSKSGCAPADLPALAKAVAALPTCACAG
jgi:Predicted enzyme with a TIM-barrel fold